MCVPLVIRTARIAPVQHEASAVEIVEEGKTVLTGGNDNQLMKEVKSPTKITKAKPTRTVVRTLQSGAMRAKEGDRLAKGKRPGRNSVSGRGGHQLRQRHG